MHQHANSDVTADFLKVLDLLEELDSQRAVKELAANRKKELGWPHYK